MPKVTKELMKAYINAMVFPPRHKHGCPKNFLRTIPLPCIAKGLTVEETNAQIQEHSKQLPCTCEE